MKLECERAEHALASMCERLDLAVQSHTRSIRPGWDGEGFHWDFRLVVDDGREIHSGSYSKGIGHGRKVYRGGQWITHPPKSPTTVEILSSLVMDASCYADASSQESFLEEFGYLEDGADGLKRGLRAYIGCREAHEALEGEFTERDLEAITRLSQML